jgi:hypothetical protein
MTKALVARSPSCSLGPRSSVTQLLLDVSLARLLFALTGALLAPFRTSARWAATAWHLAVALRRFVLRVLGFMAAPPRTPALRQLGSGLIEVRRWHLAAGAPAWPQGAGRLTQLLFGTLWAAVMWCLGCVVAAEQIWSLFCGHNAPGASRPGRWRSRTPLRGQEHRCQPLPLLPLPCPACCSQHSGGLSPVSRGAPAARLAGRGGAAEAAPAGEDGRQQVGGGAKADDPLTPTASLLVFSTPAPLFTF